MHMYVYKYSAHIAVKMFVILSCLVKISTSEGLSVDNSTFSRKFLSLLGNKYSVGTWQIFVTTLWRALKEFV